MSLRCLGVSSYRCHSRQGLCQGSAALIVIVVVIIIVIIVVIVIVKIIILIIIVIMISIIIIIDNAFLPGFAGLQLGLTVA